MQNYYPKELESIFIEINFPNKPNYICGSIYKHPSMKHLKFNKYMNKIFDKIKRKKTEGFKLETLTWICFNQALKFHRR